MAESITFVHIKNHWTANIGAGDEGVDEGVEGTLKAP